ncbi:MAG TPA: DUF1987 domain-containing protein [Halanaerobiales bacterium]|mgnify:CR=1 FL=1|nr:DUF1987 domain-containing protein [Halanaerobiales bacterium]
MDNFYIEETKSSPEIEYVSEENKLIIKGESYPEDSFSFYKPVIELAENAISENNGLKLEIEVSYLNTSSTKSFMNLLDILEEANKNGKDISVEWYYEEDNEHSYELALDFKDYLDLPFDIITKK